jgi:hypothetical protein
LTYLINRIDHFIKNANATDNFKLSYFFIMILLTQNHVLKWYGLTALKIHYQSIFVNQINVLLGYYYQGFHPPR